MIPVERLLKAARAKTEAKDANADYGFGKGKESWETMFIAGLEAAIRYKVERAIQP